MIARRGLLIIGFGLLLGAVITTITDAIGLKYIQGIIWPTDLYTFQSMETGPIDVAIFGSSRASFALSPSAMDACLTDALGRETTTVNLSRTFATAWTADVVVHDLLVGERVPDVLLLGVGPEFFNEHNHQMAPSIASHANVQDIPGLLLEAHGLQRMTATLRPLTRGVESLALFLSARHEVEAQLRWMMLHHGGGQYCYGGEACAVNNAAVKSGLSHRWAAATSTQLPRLKEDRFTRYAVGTGPVHAGMRSLIDWSRDNDVLLGVVQLPLHNTFVRHIPESVLDESSRYLMDLTLNDQIPVHRASDVRWIHKRSSYIDPDHLGPNASRLFTEHVCQGMLISRMKGAD